MLGSYVHEVITYSYEILSEAIERMTDISVHLCNVLCLPQRDYMEGAVAMSKGSCQEDNQSPSQPASPGRDKSVMCPDYCLYPLSILAPGKGGKKVTGKEGKKADAKKTPGKEKDKVSNYQTSISEMHPAPCTYICDKLYYLYIQ